MLSAFPSRLSSTGKVSFQWLRSKAVPGAVALTLELDGADEDEFVFCEADTVGAAGAEAVEQAARPNPALSIKASSNLKDDLDTSVISLTFRIFHLLSLAII